MLVALAACGEPEPTATAVPATAVPATAVQESTGSAPGSADTAELLPGRVRIQQDEGGLTLVANAAPRRALLELLAQKLAFELVAPDLGNEPVSVQLAGGELRDVLPALLPDRPYRVEYRHDPTGGRHVLTRLEVGFRGQLSLAPAPKIKRPTAPATADEEANDPAPSSPPRTTGSEPVDWRDLVLRLDAADAEDRIDVLREIEPDGDGLPLLIDRLARDPDPRVRAAAAEQLEFSETLAGVDALVQALSDPDRTVVLAAIDALELTDDPTVVEDLRPLLQHPDAEIRDAAGEAIPFILDEKVEEGEEE